MTLSKADLQECQKLLDTLVDDGYSVVSDALPVVNELIFGIIFCQQSFPDYWKTDEGRVVAEKATNALDAIIKDHDVDIETTIKTILVMLDYCVKEMAKKYDQDSKANLS